MCMIAGNIDGRVAEENEQVDHVKKSFYSLGVKSVNNY